MMRLALAVALVLLPLGAWAEDEVEPISPDRAGASTSTDTVGRGAVQLEAGLAYSRERTGGAPVERRFNVDVEMRVGLTDRLEPGSFGAPVVVQRGTVDTTDHGDFALAAKYRFRDAPERSALPSLGLLPFVKLPVSEAPLGSGKTDAGAVLLASLDLPARRRRLADAVHRRHVRVARGARQPRWGALRRGRDLAPGPRCRPRRLGRDLARRPGPRLAGPGWPEPAIRPLMAGHAL